MRELASEDPDSYCNFLKINEDMFNILLKKVVLKYAIQLSPILFILLF